MQINIHTYIHTYIHTQEDAALHAYNLQRWRVKLLDSQIDRQSRMKILLNDEAPPATAAAAAAAPAAPVAVAAPAAAPAPEVRYVCLYMYLCIRT